MNNSPLRCALYLAAQQGDVETCAAQIASGANPDDGLRVRVWTPLRVENIFDYIIQIFISNSTFHIDKFAQNLHFKK